MSKTVNLLKLLIHTYEYNKKIELSQVSADSYNEWFANWYQQWQNDMVEEFWDPTK